jgi:hypothetical protein
VAESVKKVTTIEDANIVAYLVLRGFIAIPFIQTEKGGDTGRGTDTSSRVAWDIEGDEGKVDAEIKMYYSNDKVGVHDFVRVLKDVRSSMYSVKQINNQLKGRRE